MRDEGSPFAHVSVVQAVVPQSWVEKELHTHSEGYRVEMVSTADYAVTGAASAHPLAEKWASDVRGAVSSAYSRNTAMAQGRVLSELWRAGRGVGRFYPTVERQQTIPSLTRARLISFRSRGRQDPRR
jgi:hypothetical protein